MRKSKKLGQVKAMSVELEIFGDLLFGGGMTSLSLSFSF
jgi:hypothetical protein